MSSNAQVRSDLREIRADEKLTSNPKSEKRRSSSGREETKNVPK